MSKVLKAGKQALTTAVMATTVLWSMGFASIVPVSAATTLAAGDLIKASGAAVYYYGSDGKRYVFPNEKTFKTWFADFSQVKTITDAELQALSIGGNVVYRAGTRLVKITTDPKVYAVEPGGKLRWVSNEQIAMDLYGSNWNQQIDDVNDAFFTNYTSGDSIITSTPSAGSLIKTASSSDIYYADGTTKRKIADFNAFTANNFRSEFIQTVSDTVFNTLAVGTSITGMESSIATFMSNGTTPVPVTGALTVSVASDTPASGTLLSDDALVMQNAAPILKLNFANGTSAAQTINTLKLTRGGVSVDADVNNLYLYEGSTKLAEVSGSSSKVFTFNNAAGLFSIPAGGSKTIWVGVNIAAALSGTKTINFSVNAASDITMMPGGTVAGSYPMSGNSFSIAAITDLGYINITPAPTTFPATIDPSANSQELWRFTTVANSQKMQIKKIVLTMVGTISTDAIQDLMLTVGGAQVGSTAQIGSDNKVTFDLSATPYEIASGQNKVFVLMGIVSKGTGRAFKFTIRSTADFVSTDTNYGVDTTPALAGAAFTVADPDPSGDGTNINNGTLTVSRSADAPSGNIAAGMTDQALARFDYKANGEDIKVTYVRVSVNSVIDLDATDELDNGKLYYNGSQVGTTDTVVADVTTEVYSLGNTVVIPAGTTGVFEYRADTTTNTGTALAANDTITVSLVAGSTDATGQTSLTNVATSAATGLTLTAQTGALSRAKNTSVADSSLITPTGVVGATNIKVGSLVLTAGSGESVNLTQVVLGDEDADATSNFGGNFQNLVLMHEGVALAPVQGTLSSAADADFTFSLSPTVNIPAGGQYVIDAYADILTGADGYATAEVGLEFVSATATGSNTSTDATTALTAVSLQTLVIASTGTLTITANASTPVAGQLVMGNTDQTLAIFDFTAGSPEDANVSSIVITDTTSYGGSLSNLKLYDGSTLLGTVASLSAQSDGTATFTLASNWVIPKNTTKVLTLKGSVGSFGSAVSGGSHTLNIASNANVTTRGAQSGQGIDETVTSATGTAQVIYRTLVVVDKASSSPSGTAVAGAGASILEFDAVANSGYAAILNNAALTISGSVDTTGTGNANLYKSTDTINPLATETSVQDLVSVSAAVDGQSLAVTGTSGDWDGIPVGATVLVNDTSVTTTLRGIVTAVSATVITITVVGTISGYAGIDVGVTYAPAQPGVGKLYFGAQSLLTADLADTVTTVTVASTSGFAIGDTVDVMGYDSTGTAVTRDSGCVVTAIANATQLTTTACQLSNNATIGFNYLSATAANAITNNQNSAAIAYTGTIGQSIAAGTTMKFVVKGDTTGATSDETLRADIAGVADINWDDQVNYGVITNTRNMPVLGGTLSY
ncbi:MAG: hypothetical protein Q8P11_03045 [bacterium]|nr:hypothetical protein [bacterium]